MRALHSLEFKILKQLNEPQFNDALILLLASGGRDSQSLLHALHTVLNSKFYTQKSTLVACHYNHEKRGTESDLDEKLVLDTCQSLGVLAVSEKIGHDLEKSTIKNFQDAARGIRKIHSPNLAAQLAAKSGHTKFFIFTAHHLRDHAETVVMHLLRGTGPDGLLGIDEVSKDWIRPWARVSYEEIVSYSKEKKVTFREDASNEEDKYSRNFVRLKILPLFNEMNPQYEEAIGRMSENMKMFLDSYRKLIPHEPHLTLTLSLQTFDIIEHARQTHASLGKFLTREVAQNILVHIHKALNSPRIKAMSVPLGGGWQAEICPLGLKFIQQNS